MVLNGLSFYVLQSVMFYSTVCPYFINSIIHLGNFLPCFFQIMSYLASGVYNGTRYAVALEIAFIKVKEECQKVIL